MSTDADALRRKFLRELLRVSRFQDWSVDKLEAEILKLLGEGVIPQPPVDPAQQLGPP
jgi:hypothetical protein